MENLLEVRNLSTFFDTRKGVLKAVNDVSFDLKKGEILGLVGESGSGKSVTALSIMGLIDPPGYIAEGSAKFAGCELIGMPEEEKRLLRGKRIAMIFQDPMMSLNPVLRIDTHMVESITAHRKTDRKEAVKKAVEVFRKVGIPSPEKRLKDYPHQFSGGMRQRVAIAISLLHNPELIIADEPTTALDVTIQEQILYEIERLSRENNVSLIWVTHDIAVIAGLAHKLCVMYAGKIVERGTTDEVLDNPAHPYTKGLIHSLPEMNTRGKPLQQIPGMSYSPIDLPPGCAFKERCPLADISCEQNPGVTKISENHHVCCFHPLM